jgi:hypothetical protein
MFSQENNTFGKQCTLGCSGFVTGLVTIGLQESKTRRGLSTYGHQSVTVAMHTRKWRRTFDLSSGVSLVRVSTVLLMDTYKCQNSKMPVVHCGSRGNDLLFLYAAEHHGASISPCIWMRSLCIGKVFCRRRLPRTFCVQH